MHRTYVVTESEFVLETDKMQSQALGIRVVKPRRQTTDVLDWGRLFTDGLMIVTAVVAMASVFVGLNTIGFTRSETALLDWPPTNDGDKASHKITKSDRQK